MARDSAADAICQAGAALLDPMTPHGLALRQAVAQRQGHHPETIERALRDCLQNMEHDVVALVESRPQEPMVQTQALILAGNVFTLALRPLCVSLLAGIYTRVKPASPGDPFAELFWSALMAASPQTGKLMKIERFASEDEAAFEAFLADSELVSVYGAAESIAAIESRLKPEQRIDAHGPGFGAIAIDASDMAYLEEIAQAVAHDMVAYDQAGCLSPHVLWFDGAMNEARALAEALNVALEDRAHSVAHRMPTAAAVAALRWRAEAIAHEFFGDRTHAICLRSGADFRPSPGHRHITIAVCSADERARAMEQAGPFLKAVSTTSGGAPPRVRFSAEAPPRLSALGQMQSPPLDHIWDGRSLWTDLRAPG